MLRRHKKQFLIGLIYFFILLSIFFLVYFNIKSEPSCNDGIRNQGEEKIDCGGPCDACQELQNKNLKVFWAKALINQEDNSQYIYDLVAKVKNSNLNYGSGEVSYSFRIYNSANEIIKTYTGVTYILNNQTKYLIQPQVKLQTPIQKTEISFKEINWRSLEKDTVSVGDLMIQNKEFQLLGDSDFGYSRLKAVLLNKTSYDFDVVKIRILAFDKNHNLLSARQTEVNTLLSGEKREFTVTWFRDIKGEIAFIEARPDTNLFDSDNYLSNVPQTIEKFQEY